MLKRGKYRHYKGAYYEVLGVVMHTETQAPMVHYKALYTINKVDTELYGNDLTFVRPLKMWLDKVTVKGIPVERFTYLENAHV